MEGNGEDEMDFTNAARTWDDDPVRRERAETVAGAMRKFLPWDGPRGTALELGCGTGLLSFSLADAFARIVLMDEAPGMLEVVTEKIRQSARAHMAVVRGDIQDIPDNGTRYDAVYMLMALHHARDPMAVLRRCYKLLNPVGLLFVADLDKEDGSFHAASPDFSGQNGFGREELKADVEEIGFRNVVFEDVFTVKKQVGKGERAYPVFLLKAAKP
jgi:2-polyprenyl-3-methyl-5-hydroxy-6-metoxy-1,4-benzoquinol methylase